MDPSVAALCAAHRFTGSPEDLIRRLVAELLVDGGNELPTNLEVIASYRGAVIVREAIDGEGSIRWDGVAGRYVITLSSLQPPAREPFTLAHEIIHTYFMEASGNRAQREHDEQVASFDPRGKQEEYLCDIGAAELTMPTPVVTSMLPPQPTMSDVIAVSEACGSSVEASARRVVELSGMPGSAIVLEQTLKPTEERALARLHNSATLPGLEPAPPTPKMRVRYATRQGMDYIPPAKSVDASSPLADILASGSTDFIGHTGLTMRQLAVSARLLPFYRGEEYVERVVVIAFDAEAWRTRSGMAAV